jgi:hypothetical protein
MHRGGGAFRYGVANLFGSEKDRGVDKDSLILKRVSASRLSGQWNDDDFDVLADGQVVGRIFKANAAPVGTPWMWTLAFGHHEDRTPTHGYEPTREAAMAAFAKSWRGLRQAANSEMILIMRAAEAALPCQALPRFALPRCRGSVCPLAAS